MLALRFVLSRRGKNVQKVANNIFVFAPENVAIFADGENKPYNFGGGENGSNPWK